MKRFIILICLIAAPAYADDRAACILAAAEHLPRVAGLEITSADAQEMGVRPQDRKIVKSQFIVTVNFIAAAQRMAATYRCEVGVTVGPVITAWPPP